MIWVNELIRNGLVAIFTFSWFWVFIGSAISFWMAWIIIPIIMEIVPAMGNFVILLKRRRATSHKETRWEMPYAPEISLILPVYNSGRSLYRCIESIRNSRYPPKKITLIISNNESTDDSFDIFVKCQKDFPDLNMTWVNGKQGKSKALNLALFNSNCKYIIHIDTDGILHPEALYNMALQFENELDVDSITGTVMVNPNLIENSEGFGKRLLRRLEFFEYGQAFLAGKNFQAEFNTVYTMSGAFSAFRKSAILKTQMFNADTVSEDTHLTFQLREILKAKITICSEAVFFADPVEDINELYIQRQRWQRGQIEVTHMFMKKKMYAVRGFVKNNIIRILMYDHTFAFPRMIWYFALICLIFLNYPMELIVVSLVLIYILYIFVGLLYYINVLLFLKELKTLRRYYASKLYLIFLLPAFNFVVFWFRFAGIINSLRLEKTWKSMNLNEELAEVKRIIAKDFFWLTRARGIIGGAINKK